MDTQQKVLALTKHLITLQTVSTNKQANADALRYIYDYLQDSSLFLKQYRADGFSSLVISNKLLSKNTFDLILHGHIDVIPSDNPHDFIPKEKDGKLYGRGSLDMKGSLAAMITLMQELQHEHYKKNIALFITSDEELGGKNGTAYLLSKEKYRGKFFITGEGGSQGFLIHNKTKGTLLFTLKVRGTSAHGARIWQGENAIEKLFAVYKDIKDLLPPTNDPDHWYTTANLSIIQGGDAINKVPSYAEGIIDIRFTEEWNMDNTLVDNIQTLIKTKYTGVDLVLLFKDPMLDTSEENIYLQKLHAIATKYITPTKSLLTKTHGSGDVRFPIEVGIPAVEFGPTGRNSHTQNEYLDINSLYTFYDILKEFIANF